MISQPMAGKTDEEIAATRDKAHAKLHEMGMFKAIQDFAGVLLMGFILAVLVFLMWKALRKEGYEAWGYDKTFVVGTFGIFALIALIVFGCFTVDAITHLAVPQAAMINDMLEMVQNG